MVRKFAAVIAALLLIPAVATGGMEWKDETPALKVLKTYTDNINKLLTETGEHPINSLFSCFSSAFHISEYEAPIISAIL